MWQAHLRGLATAIHEISGLEEIFFWSVLIRLGMFGTIGKIEQ
jgi:hypothetical protein